MNKKPKPTTPLILSRFGGLVDAGALSHFQAAWLAENWRGLPDDWAAHPYLQSVREHTRLYIDRLRQQEAA